MNLRLALFSAGLSCLASFSSYAQEIGARGDVFGVMNLRTGIFKAIPVTPTPAAALSAVGGTVNTTITGTIAPALAATVKVYCTVYIYISAANYSITPIYSYAQTKSGTALATITGNSFSCAVTLEYLAHLVVANTNPMLAISYSLIGIDPTVEPLAVHVHGVDTRDMGGEDPISIPLPANGTTTKEAFTVVF
jgi:hypothetical protein